MKSPRPVSDDQILLFKGLVFLPTAAVILVGLTVFFWELLPQERGQALNISDMKSAPAGGKQSLLDKLFGRKRPIRSSSQSPKSWWEKLASGLRSKARGEKMLRRSRKQGENLDVNHRETVASTLTDEKQMITRQSILATEMLANVEGRGPDTVPDRVAKPFVGFPWSEYEDNRLLVRVLGQVYERSHNPALISRYARVASDVASSDYANFEDYFNAGHANLYAGNISRARNYLLEAEKNWPVKRGTVRGLNSLLILICDAIANRQEEFFDRLEALPADFSDWMFTEIYLPDVVRLEAAHPRAPLLHVLHGRILELTYNDAAALAQYRQASGLVGMSRTIVREWTQNLESRSK